MHSACISTQSNMYTLIGLEENIITGLLSDAKQVYPNTELCIANYLFPKGYVVSGSRDAILLVNEKASAMGCVTKKVAVAGAFHSPLMKPALPSLQAALEVADISMPTVPVYSNVTGQPYMSIEEIRANLVTQVIKPVLWESTIRNMLETNDKLKFVEIGSGTSLKAILKRIDKKAFKSCQSVEV